MSDFGHIGILGPGFCIDAWGVGPFKIVADGQHFRFEDSDAFGPHIVTLRRGEIARQQPSERSPFWRAHWLWRRQGRKLGEDGETCVWREPKPTIYAKCGRQLVVVEAGEVDGRHLLDGKPLDLGDGPA